MLRETIIRKLQTALAAASVEVVDDSAAHAGHAGVRESGGGHYSVRVVSARFAGQPLLSRHRLVYQALQEEMRAGIHALKIEALAPAEDPVSRV